jgi:hypothetical protein
MSVANERVRQGDVSIDYDFEDVIFRDDASSRRFFRKFHGESMEDEDPFANRLLRDANDNGVDTEAAAYHPGEPGS